MHSVIEKVKEFFEKRPLLTGTLMTAGKTMLIATAVVLAVFLVLWATGIYDTLETAVDLKYNSPILLIPFWTCAALFVMCLMGGGLMYFHKYKRTTMKTSFYHAIAPAFGLNTKKKAE